MNKITSEKIFLRYLNGDNSVTLEDVKKLEKEERFESLLTKFSFNQPFLKYIVVPFVFIFSICFDSSY